MKRTKIVCTMGPSTDDPEILGKIIDSGMDVARFNFSHGTYPEQKKRMDLLKQVRREKKKPIAILLDTKGPEVRTGTLKGGKSVKLESGQTFTLTTRKVEGSSEMVSQTYKDLPQDLKAGDRVLIDDGLIEMKVVETTKTDVICRVENGGMLGERKGVNLPNVEIHLPNITDKDKADILFGIEQDIDFIAASFVRNADAVREIRDLLREHDASDVHIIAKIENAEGIRNIDSIIRAADGVMVARGDMGVEIPMEQVPIVQKRFIKRCNEVGKPVITATQMLESMISNPRPTRAEVSDVANAVYDLTGCIMLSGECAMGKYPVECVKDMVKISTAIEGDIKYWKRFASRSVDDTNDLKANIAYTACVTAKDVSASAIVAYTHTGETAKLLSGFRPSCPVIAITDDVKTYHKLSLAQNVMPVFIGGESSIDNTIGKGILSLEEQAILEKGDKIVIAGGDKILPLEKESQVIGGIMNI